MNTVAFKLNFPNCWGIHFQPGDGRREKEKERGTDRQMGHCKVFLMGQAWKWGIIFPHMFLTGHCCVAWRAGRYLEVVGPGIKKELASSFLGGSRIFMRPFLNLGPRQSILNHNVCIRCFIYQEYFCWFSIVVIFLIIWFKSILTWYCTANPFSLDCPIFMSIILIKAYQMAQW